jgi:hypothetical protein
MMDVAIAEAVPDASGYGVTLTWSSGVATRHDFRGLVGTGVLMPPGP